MRIIGITGGVGAGKSEVLRYIQKHYRCQIYLADEVAHQVEQPGTECYDRLVELLGRDVLSEDGTFNKSAVSGKIFRDDSLRKRVNAIVHPAVRDYLLERMAEARGNPSVELFFVEAALLIECGYGALVDEMWYVHAERNARRERLRRNRGYTEERIAQIMASQMDEDAFRSGSDFVIDNSGALEDVYRQIDKKLEAYTWLE